MSLDLRECCRDTACSELSLEPLSRMPSPLPAARCMTPPFAQLASTAEQQLAAAEHGPVYTAPTLPQIQFPELFVY